MLKALIYSSILIARLSVEPDVNVADCKLLNAEAKVTNSSAGKDDGAATVSVSGVGGQVKYFFCNEDGKVLNEEQINSNKIENLKRGTYYCIVSAERCTSKLKIIIE